jgi:hypothetical protein
MRPLPLIVYKYRSWDNVQQRNALIYNEIYLASPKDFNDPFDCRISPNFNLLTKEDEKQYIIDMGIAGYQVVENQKLNLDQVLNNLESKLKDKESIQKEYNTLLFGSQDKYYGIFALSSRWNSILMWSHYANCHKGYCIGYWLNKLWNSNIFGKFGYVNYQKDFPKIKPSAPKKDEEMIKNSFIETFTKSEEWIYEDEFRFYKGFFPNVPLSYHRVLNVPDDFIAEVVLGINISDNYKAEISDLCRSKKIPLYQTIKVDNRFVIDRLQI